jgi:hypothetical protein
LIDQANVASIGANQLKKAQPVRQKSRKCRDLWASPQPSQFRAKKIALFRNEMRQ